MSRAVTPGPLRSEGGVIRDREGRQVILRGVNYSGRHKQPPHLLDDPAPLDRVRDWGFNVIRLVLVWEAIEPERGRIDRDYLARVAALAREATDRGLYVIMDMHQDVYARATGGSGAPAWTLPPEQRVDDPLSNPHWFLGYAMSEPVREALARFFTDVDGVQGHFVAAARAAAEALFDNPGVIGFDIYNEPFGGTLDIESFEATHLGPFYRRVIAAVREVAPSWIAFYEGALFTSESGSSLDLSPLSNLVYLPHFYVKLAHAARAYDGHTAEMEAAFAAFSRDAARWGVPWMLGEYGPSYETLEGAAYQRDHEDALERHGVGGVVWQFNPSELDWNDERIGLTTPTGEEAPHTSAAIRPYPRAMAGRIETRRFDPETGTYTLTYTAEAGESVISAPARCFGGSPEVACIGGSWAYDREQGLLVVQAEPGARVTLTVRPGAGDPT